MRYLGRYTHRVGISNRRLVSMDERGVTFRTKDGKSVTLHARRVPRALRPARAAAGFVKIRHYGLHAAATRPRDSNSRVSGWGRRHRRANASSPARSTGASCSSN